MNLDLYNSEFRDFKYLKSSPEDVAYYKRRASEVNRIQLGPEANDPTFVWPCRLEFIEQLLDLRDDVVYIVQPTAIKGESTRFSDCYMEARLYVIEKPIIVYGPLISPKTLDDIITEDDIDRMLFAHNLCVCSSIENTVEQIVIKITDIGLLPGPLSHVAVFYDKEWAGKYQKAVTDYLRKNNDAVSAISRLF